MCCGRLQNQLNCAQNRPHCELDCDKIDRISATFESIVCKIVLIVMKICLMCPTLDSIVRKVDSVKKKQLNVKISTQSDSASLEFIIPQSSRSFND